MEIPALGLGLVVLGAIVFVTRPRWLFALTVFSIPFSATAVINVPAKQFSLLASTFFGALWIGRLAMDSAFTGRIAISRYLRTPFLLLGLFVLSAALSLVMPFYIDGRLTFTVINLVDFGTTYQVRFSPWHIVHFSYIVYGTILTCLVASSCRDPDQLHVALRLSLISGLVVGLIALSEWLIFQFGDTSPLGFLNTSVAGVRTLKARPFQDLGFLRLTSVAEEPSVLAQQLLAILPFSLFAVVTRTAILGRFMDGVILVVLPTALLLSTSATAYVGLLALLVVTGFVCLRFPAARFRYLSFVLIFGAGGALVYGASSTVQEFVQSFVLSKPTSGSGIERLSSVILGWEYFSAYPVLGVGWGVVPVFDLIVKLLVGVGMVGAFVFVVLVGYVLHDLFRAWSGPTKSSYLPVKTLSGAAFVALAIVLIVSETSGFMHQFGTFWMTLGIAMGIGAQNREAARNQATLPTSSERV